MRQKAILITGTNEAETWLNFKDWLDTSNPVVVPNLWHVDIPGLRIAVVYSEQPVIP